tara:strand:+ start:6334 stop:7698 length:1365 start_codon:yes stop_codon:yes gene_type:complete
VLLISFSLSIAIPAFAEVTVVEEATNESKIIPYQITASNSSWEDKEIDPSFYDNPYQISLFSPTQGEDSERLLSQTYSIFGLGLGVIGVLAIMPTEVTNWETSNLDLGKKWSENVKAGPVWDRDDVILNYMMHPYFGGVYYQTARKSGYRQWDAFLYSVVMSTFFWEYGIEAFAETPSLQDLVVTPVLGWAYGEWAYTTERDIWNNDGRFLGSKHLGQLATILLDPVDSFGRSFNELIGRDLIKAGTGYFTYNEVALPSGNTSENQIGFKVSYVFGDDNGAALPGISGQRAQRSQAEYVKDPVHTGIIGVSAGPVFIDLDSQWDKQSTWGYQWSLGLYFTPRFSSRLHYSRAIIDDNQNANRIIYENYGVDSQYYFNSEANLRPFVTAGLSEMMIDEDDTNKHFQINAGLGLHYKINQNWAIQTDWKHYYSDSLKTHDNLLGSAIVYRFGTGEE